MSEPTHPIVEMTDEALDGLLHRALRNTAILGLLPAAAVFFASGWRNAGMLLTGAAISAASIWEWQRLVQLFRVRMDKQRTPASTAATALFFVLRLTLFGAAIYGSLKCFRGSVFALFYGLSLAVLTLGWEALRLLRE